jgi:hypothetical protein
MRDEIHIPIDRLDESQMRQLMNTYASCAEGDFPEWGKRWYASLADALGQALQVRAMQWLGVLSDPAVPPSWDVAVSALPPED